MRDCPFKSKFQIQVWLFHVLRSRPCPRHYLAHLYVVSSNIISVAVLRPCHINCQNFNLR